MIGPYPARRQPFEPFEIAFALTHHNLPQSEYPLPVTGFHRAIIDTPCDASPPMGVLCGSIDSIELTLILAPLTSLSLTTQPFSAQGSAFHAPQECSPSVVVRFMKERSSTTTPYSFSDHLSINAEKSDQDLLFQSYESDSLPPEDLSIDQSERGLDEAGMVRLSRWHTQQSPYHCLSQPSVYKRSGTAPLSMTCQSTLDSPAFMRLIDLSLRHTVGGTLSWRKDPKWSSTDGRPLELVKAASDISLADISPALFRPGYMKVIIPTSDTMGYGCSKVCNAGSFPACPLDLPNRILHLQHQPPFSHSRPLLYRSSNDFFLRNGESSKAQPAASTALAPPSEAEMAHRAPRIATREYKKYTRSVQKGRRADR